MSYIHEEWKPVVGFAQYVVSNCGRIRHVDKIAYRNPTPNTNGYLSLTVTREGKKHTRMIHTLVARAFLGERPFGYQINHIDANRQNNFATNLEYVTPAGNSQHAVKMRPPRTLARPAYRIPKANVDIIRICLPFYSNRELATLFGVTKTTVAKIRNGLR
jgi:hypothetical protein